jgi:hypothetical protein
MWLVLASDFIAKGVTELSTGLQQRNLSSQAAALINASVQHFIPFV